ncbi:hypothetical protein DFH09DRAFT_340876 [Mycena vulgaris]|nr:hypothetical protein DFH09DRAFT_340876 [Mycena vulgaris]
MRSYGLQISMAIALGWGIISTGKLARCSFQSSLIPGLSLSQATNFVRDLLVDPKTWNVHDVVHKMAAVGSRTVEKAQEFIGANAGGDAMIKAYGTYEEVNVDKDVDPIYIGTYLS